MKNRKAWGLVAVLAFLVAVGVGVLVDHFQSRLPPGQRYVELIPSGDRRFGSYFYSFGPPDGVPNITERWVRLGFFQVRLERHETKPGLVAPSPSPPAP
jgi:hypothetical protein